MIFLYSGKNIIFDDKKISKSNFCKTKKLIHIDDVDVNKILVSKNGTKNTFKYVIGYNDNDDIMPLFIKLPQIIGYVELFDSNKTMSFKVSGKRLLKNCTKIWGKISSLMNKIINSEPIYSDSDKYIKANIKSFVDKINANFQVKKMAKENISYKCLLLIMRDSVIRVNKTDLDKLNSQ